MDTGSLAGFHFDCAQSRCVGKSLDQVRYVDPSEFGHLLETFVVGELRQQSTQLEDHVQLSRGAHETVKEVNLVVRATHICETAGRVLRLQHRGDQAPQSIRIATSTRACCRSSCRRFQRSLW